MKYAFQLNSPMDSNLLTISNDTTGDGGNPEIPTLSVMYHTWTIGAPKGGISYTFKLTWKMFNYTAYYSLIFSNDFLITVPMPFFDWKLLLIINHWILGPTIEEFPFFSTVKSRFRKLHFFFLKSRVVWFKKDLCTESKNRSSKKMFYPGEFTGWDLF